jgi:hypothetical protein
VGAAAAPRLCEDGFTVVRDTLEDLITYLKSGDAAALSHSALEHLLNARGQELLRQLLQAHLDARGPGAAAGPVRGADGIARNQARLHERDLSTIFGEVQVRRLGYGAEKVESLHPLDAELNLPPEQYSFGLRRRAAEEAAKGSFEETVQSLAAHTGTAIGKRQVEQLVRRAAADFDAFYAQRQPDARAPTAPLLVLTVDGKGVVMRREDLREGTRQAAATRQHKLGTRLSKGEKRNAKRMATVAAVYTVAPFVRTPQDVVRTLAPAAQDEGPKRPRPEHKRVWASLQKSPDDVIADAFVEAHRRDPDQTKRWVALVDGSDPQLARLEKTAQRAGVPLTIVLDVMHVAEYLWSASLAFHAEDSPEREAWVGERLLAVLEGRASLVAAGMRRSATRRDLSAPERKSVDDCARYLLNHKAYLRYDEYLEAGLPIATGVIEGACRHLVKDRMDVTGARWSLAGAEAVLRLRALRASGDFEEYWQFHEQQEHQRNHAARYADGKAVPLRGRHLRPVK